MKMFAIQLVLEEILKAEKVLVESSWNDDFKYLKDREEGKIIVTGPGKQK